MPLIGLLEQLELLVLLERLARCRAPACSSRSVHVDADHHRAHHVTRAAARRPDGHDRLDQVAVVELAHGGDLLAGQAAAQLAPRSDRGSGRSARMGSLTWHELLAAGVEHGDAC